MIKAYFIDKKIIGFQEDGVGEIPKFYDEIATNLTETDLLNLYKGYEYVDGEIIDSELVELTIKDTECQEEILKEYPWKDQSNIARKAVVDPSVANMAAVNKMHTFIEAMRVEFHKMDNYQEDGIIAEYSDITP